MLFILIAIFLFTILISAIITTPFVLIVLICLTVVFKKPWVFVLAFLGGLYLDLIIIRSLGLSSVFFLIFIFLLFLYERKFEIQSVPFVFFAGFLGSLGYLVVFGYDHLLEQAVASSVIAVLLFKALSAKFKAQSVNLQLRG